MKSFIDKLRYELDPELNQQFDLQLNFSGLEQKESEVHTFYNPFYQNKIIVDKNSGLPLTYSSDLVFDSKKHSLVDYFSESQIKSFAYHNDAGTLAYIPKGIAAIKLYVRAKIKTPEQLIPIVTNYIWLNESTTAEHKLRAIRLKHLIPLFSKNELYNLLLILNGRLTDPLPEYNVNKLTSYIQHKISSNELQPTIERMTTIRTKDFLVNYMFEQAESEEDVTVLSAVMSTINQIKAKIYRSETNKLIDDYLDKNPELEYMQLVRWLADKQKISVQHAKRLIANYRQGAIRSHPMLINYSSMGGDHFAPSDKSNKSERKIKRFVRQWSMVNSNGSGRLTQKSISDGTGLSLRTVKNKWQFTQQLIQQLDNEQIKKEEATPLINLSSPVSGAVSASHITPDPDPATEPKSSNCGRLEKERDSNHETDCTRCIEPEADLMELVDQLLKHEFQFYGNLTADNPGNRRQP